MTISTEVRKAGPFIGNDSASVFPFAFKVFKAADLIVVRRQDNIGAETTLVLDSDYHVTLNGNQDTTPGGVVTLVAGALASGFTLVVSSELPYLQPTDLTNQGGFYPKVITNALDRLTIFCQQLAEITGRTLKLPITAPTNISAEIPLPNPSELIAWDETGTRLTTVSPQSLVTSIAYGSATADLFAGDGVTTTFPLTTNPASVNNLDVSIGGHSQRPVQDGVGDYSWNGGASITFVTPPPAPTVPGDKNVLVRYMQAIPVSDSEALHAQTREALRRSYAEAGYNLVEGSFETGGTLTAAMDVLLQESTGAAYAWTGALPKTVAPGFDPVGVAGFELRNLAALRAYLSSSVGSNLIGTTDGSTVAGRLLALKRVSPIETRFAGGADPTGVADSTDALQACIDYCAPFVWQGSVAATKAAMGNCVAAMSGFGKFRITRPLKINPFLVVTADQVGAHYGDNSGFQIIADFTDKDAFALDTAPYNSSGIRVLGMLSNRTDWDGGGYTGCPGWLLRGVEVTVAPGRNIRGTLNRNMAQQSHLEYCNLWGGNIGVQSSCCWGGSMRLNLINGRAIGVYNTRDTTVDEQQANYITVSGVKPVSGTEFTYPTWPDSTLQGKTTPCYNEYAHPNFFHNILEGGQIAIMCTNQSSLHLLDNYIEGSFEYCYAFHSVAAKVSVRWVISEVGNLLHSTGSTLDVDTSGASYLSVLGWGYIDAYSTVRTKGDLARTLPWHSKVDYTDAQLNGVVDVYVSSSGGDANSGYLQSKPVKTLQEAIDRCKAGFYNKINLTGGLVGTKYNYTSGGNASNKIVRLDTVEINGEAGGTLYVGSASNQLESLPMGISRVVLRGISSITVDSVSDNYKPMIPAFGVVNIEITACSMSGGVLTGVKNGLVGMANITARDSTLACQLQHNGGVANSFSWIDTAVNTSVAGGSVGSVGSKKISSVLYP